MEKPKSMWKSFPGSFWAGNTMEIFERMGWYGFYAVSSLYLTGAVSEGGLGLTSEDRGIIQGIITFFLYLFPAVFGALADKYGFKKMFLASFVVMSPLYILLSLPKTFWGFFMVYFFIAIGHGMFKPVVTGTIAKTTDERTGTMGFGIFYWMVNVGGFLGPIVAGIVRGWDWKYVFYASAFWLGINFFICLIFYKEPKSIKENADQAKSKSLKQVLDGMMFVVGNARFFILISGIMIALVMGSKWWSFATVGIFTASWFIFNFLWDAILRAAGKGQESHWLLQPMKIGETRFLIFLLLMAGFWVSFNQIFITLPEYIRDYGKTGDLIRMFGLENAGKAILKDGEIKPEFLINLNAFGIICLQMFVSWFARKWRPFTTIISGVMVTVGSFFLFLLGASGTVIAIGILVFSVGEMLASPKSKEYVGRIAPPEKVGMYMGYFYWCVAIGNLFGGLLSGVAYGYFGPKGIDKPGIMWIIFAALASTTAIMLFFYNRWVTKNPVK